MARSEPTRVEQFIDGYGRVKLAIAFDYDEQRTNRMSSVFDNLDWEEHHPGADDTYEFADGTTEFARTVDRSSHVLRELRETVGLGIPPVEEIPWHVSVYTTSPGDSPITCEACDSETVLSDRGLRAVNLHNSAWMEIIESEESDASQVCTACGQLYDYQVHESDDRPTHVAASTDASEVM